MNKARLFQFLSDQDASFLLDLISAAYDQMDLDQRRWVFGKLVAELPPGPVDGEVLLEEIEEFQRESLAGAYYEPFDINSRNWTHIPDETEEWFDRLGDLLKASCQLTVQSDQVASLRHAAACFGILYKLMGAMESGEEIVFGDEIGSWMIPGDGKQYIAAYMTSLAATTTPEKFTEVALPLIRRDSFHSFADQAYPSAVRAANEAQRAHLEAEIQRQNIRTERR